MSHSLCLSRTQLHISGQGSLGVSGSNTTVNCNTVHGDSSGLLTVRPGQRFRVISSVQHLPFSVLAQERSHVDLPLSTACRAVELVLRGTIDKISNLTVGPHCRFTLENSTGNRFNFDHVVVQTDGFMAATRADQQRVEIKGKTLDIRGGAKVGFM